MTSAQQAEGRQLDPGQVYDLQRNIICRVHYSPAAYDIWLLQDRPEFESTLAEAMSSHRRGLGSTKTSLKENVRSSATIEGPVAQWIRHRPTEPGIAGSSPAGVMRGCGFYVRIDRAVKTSGATTAARQRGRIEPLRGPCPWS